MTKIHHNTLKKAKAHGIVLTVEDGEIVASKNGVRLASHLSGTVALQTAIDKLGSEGVQIQAATAGVRAAKAPKTKAPKKMSAHEQAARDEGWTGKGGAFRHAEQESDSDAKDWRALCAEQEIEVEGDDEGKSIVKRKYRQACRPHHNRCGDDLATQISEHVMAEGEDGEPCVDKTRLRAFARANECWDPKYAAMNAGMQRMNIGNRLRAKVKKGHKVIWS